jgi:Co-chaperonin GroES (HSP10)
MAEIVAIGPDIENDEKKSKQVKLGDKVIFSKYSGTEVKLDKEEYTIVKLNDILAVIE